LRYTNNLAGTNYRAGHDVGFGEDRDRKRAGHAAQNFSILNRIALNLLKHDKSSKRGIKGKRLKAAWNTPDLLKLLGI